MTPPRLSSYSTYVDSAQRSKAKLYDIANDCQSPTVSISPTRQTDPCHPDEEPYLLVIAPGSSAVFRLPSKPEVTIGRSLDVDLQLQHTSVSRRHAQLTWHDDSLWVKDLGSHNGLSINGERHEGPRPLASGDVLAIGEILLVLHRGAKRLPSSPLLDSSGLRRHLCDEIERALRYQRPLTILHLELGPTTAMSEDIATRLLARLELLDRIAVLSSTELVVIMPDRDEEELHEQIEPLLGTLPAVTRAGCSQCPADGSDPDTLLLLARRAAAASRGSIVGPAAIPSKMAIGEHEILVADPAMLRLYELIERLGPSPIPILISGETGTGKELAAAAVHYFSPRRAHRLLAINCAAIPESLAESELFGHERGAFSGAVATRMGLLESAQGGTVFLDEIGELSLPLQAKLLRALETRRIVRIGDSHERPLDIRVIAATHRDLEAEARAGRFRQDLYFRLAAAVVNVPPLRHRIVELPMLARTFLLAARRRNGKPPLHLGAQAMARILAYPWPGNVRELKNDMEFLATTIEAGPVELWHLPPKLGGSTHLGGAAAKSGPVTEAAPNSAKPPFLPLEEELRALERKRITEALVAAGGVQSRAAELLGMPRRTFFAKTKQYGLMPAVTSVENRAR